MAYALKWAVVMNSGRRAMATVFTFLLAALLGPHDFGVVAVALVFIAFVRIMLEQGFLTAIIQREDLRDEHLDAAFWLNLVWCLVLAGICVASAGWWADVNDMPTLGPVIQVLSLLIVFEGLQIVQHAIVERQLDFKQLAVRTNAAVLLGGLVGVPLALAGAGVWALVGQQVAMELSLTVLLWGLTRWRPRVRFSRSHARDLLGFSSNVFAANLAGFVNRRADALMMGIFFGPVAVGVYRIADRVVEVLLDVTLRPVGLVSLPVLSRLQADPDELRRTVVRLLRTTLLATIPVLMILFACSDEVLAVLGERWTVAADGLKLLCLVGIGKAVGYFTGPVLFAASRPRFRAVMLGILAVVSVVSVAGVGLALSGSSVHAQVFGMAASRALLFVPILIPVNLLIISRVTGMRLRSLAPAVPAPLLAGLAALGAEQLLHATGAIQGLPPLAALAAVGSAATAAAAAVLLTLEPRVRSRLRGLVSDLRSRPLAPAEST